MGIFCRNQYKMAKRYKWEMIIDIEVQGMKGMIMFSSKDLVWFEIHRENMRIDRVALISSQRILDFIKGEEASPATPCTFVRKQNKKPTKMTSVALQCEM